MRGAARLAAARAVALDHGRELARELEADRAAETASAHGSGCLRVALRSFDARKVHSWRVGFVLGQVVGDLVPRGLRADEDVSRRTNARIPVEVPGGHEDDLRPRGHGRNDGSAHRTVSTRRAGRRLVGRRLLVAAQPAEAARLGADEAGERRPVQLAAHRAVAVGHRELAVDRPCDRAAETARLDHGSSSEASASISDRRRRYGEP